MKTNEVFIVTGWAHCADSIEFTVTAGGRKVIIANDGQTASENMIIIANKDSGTLFVGQTGEPVSFVLDINTLLGDLPLLGWAVADAQAAFRGEFGSNRLMSDTIRFNAVNGGWDIDMSVDTPVREASSCTEQLTDDDTDENIACDLKLLSYYGDTADANEARQLLTSRETAAKAEKLIADMIRRSHEDLIRYRTEI